MTMTINYFNNITIAVTLLIIITVGIIIMTIIIVITNVNLYNLDIFFSLTEFIQFAKLIAFSDLHLSYYSFEIINTYYSYVPCCFYRKYKSIKI